jgi:hypothetical protein
VEGSAHVLMWHYILACALRDWGGCISFNDAISSSDCAAPNSRKNNELDRICGLIRGTTLTFAWRHWRKPQKKRQDSWCPGQGVNWSPPEHKSEALPFQPPCLAEVRKPMQTLVIKITDLWAKVWTWDLSHTKEECYPLHWTFGSANMLCTSLCTAVQQWLWRFLFPVMWHCIV